ncbi:MAG: EF-hand domain-containing protein [Sphingomonadaceae bacterium]|nr:EF-hand domain-containing protein [Sphingomonadaceae bacterium]
MWRFLAGAVAALLLVGAGLFWRSSGTRPSIAPATAVANAAMLATEDPAPPLPPTATAVTREQARFNRYDKNRDGIVSRDEYLANRRKAFARLDTNGDGKLSFEEYAVKTSERFASADTDKSGTLTPKEFEATRVARNTSRRPKCPPQAEAAPAPADDGG